MHQVLFHFHHIKRAVLCVVLCAHGCIMYTGQGPPSSGYLPWSFPPSLSPFLPCSSLSPLPRPVAPSSLCSLPPCPISFAPSLPPYVGSVIVLKISISRCYNIFFNSPVCKFRFHAQIFVCFYVVHHNLLICLFETKTTQTESIIFMCLWSEMIFIRSRADLMDDLGTAVAL